MRRTTGRCPSPCTTSSPPPDETIVEVPTFDEEPEVMSGLLGCLDEALPLPAGDPESVTELGDDLRVKSDALAANPSYELLTDHGVAERHEGAKIPVVTCSNSGVGGFFALGGAALALALAFAFALAFGAAFFGVSSSAVSSPSASSSSTAARASLCCLRRSPTEANAPRTSPCATRGCHEEEPAVTTEAKPLP
eukprot:CAMPEP_0170603778 /NCGR_PEP_ID=MMETSP0224-20130122/19087_1 /TAXON_ID=285029 /ORGANISM="Togula jolla, Strain CCCM 725" /LENGTH=193 /DNA_ID=CAMNT_0010928669 /DNA_START=79 /DNA_END=662 /DNA_ORIENTATION=-